MTAISNKNKFQKQRLANDVLYFKFSSNTASNCFYFQPGVVVVPPVLLLVVVVEDVGGLVVDEVPVVVPGGVGTIPENNPGTSD